MKNTTVAVIYGGNSPEHSISCISAASIMKEMGQYTIVPIGITRDGGWYLGDGDLDKLSQHGRKLPEVTPTPGKEVALLLDPTRRGTIVYTSGDHAGEEVATIDVVLPVLHGPNGEDGTIQGLFELAGVPYVGCGVAASANSMDKEFTKVVLGHAGLPVGTQVVMRAGTTTLTDSEKDMLGLPVFVKPARGGSSISISKVTTWEDFPAAVDFARTCDSKVIVESAIKGREVECGVLEFASGDVHASPIAEICIPESTSESSATVTNEEVTEPSDGGNFYDFDTKYLDDVINVDLPAKVPESVSDEVRELAVKAFRAIDGKGLARVDFFITEQGPVINEINTFPGFTSISMYPKMWAAQGVSYPDLIATLIDTELARHTA